MPPPGDRSPPQSFSDPGPSSSQDTPGADFIHPDLPLSSDESSSATEPLVNAGRTKRTIRLPARFRDVLPDAAPASEPSPQPEDSGLHLPRVTLIVRDTFKTAVTNMFGLWRHYLHRPSYDPDSLIRIEDLSNSHGYTPDPAPQRPLPAPSASNPSTTLLMNWLNNGNTTKSEAELNALVNDVVLNPAFNSEELVGFDANRANKQVDQDARAAFPLLHDFEEASIDIQVPSGSPTIPPQTIAVPGLYYRRLVPIIKSAFTDPLSYHFHLSPFKLWRKIPSSDEGLRVYSEVYNSDAFITEHDNIQRRGKLPPDDLGCRREKVVTALMFWSDSTHLTNFGTAKLWPIYMSFGNLSKYIRNKPGIGAEHHVAYIPSVRESNSS